MGGPWAPCLECVFRAGSGGRALSSPAIPREVAGSLYGGRGGILARRARWDGPWSDTTGGGSTTCPRPDAEPPVGTGPTARASSSPTAPDWCAESGRPSRHGTLPNPAVASGRGRHLLGGTARRHLHHLEACPFQRRGDQGEPLAVPFDLGRHHLDRHVVPGHMPDAEELLPTHLTFPAVDERHALVPGSGPPTALAGWWQPSAPLLVGATRLRQRGIESRVVPQARQEVDAWGTILGLDQGPDHALHRVGTIEDPQVPTAHEAALFPQQVHQPFTLGVKHHLCVGIVRTRR